MTLREARDIYQKFAPCMAEERLGRMDQVLAGRLGGLTLLIEHLIDPHNGAAVLRSAEAFGLSEVHIVEGERHFGISARISQGCERWLELKKHPATAAAMSHLRDRGFKLAAAVPGGSTALADIDFSTPTALLLGNENRGLSQEAIASADVCFGLEMFGMTQSLNLSVATAVALSHASAGRRRAIGKNGDLDEETKEIIRATWILREWKQLRR